VSSLKNVVLFSAVSSTTSEENYGSHLNRVIELVCIWRMKSGLMHSTLLSTLKSSAIAVPSGPMLDSGSSLL
jgi:hypothetical protein